MNFLIGAILGLAIILVTIWFATRATDDGRKSQSELPGWDDTNSTSKSDLYDD